jgi:hypothetical protein
MATQLTINNVKASVDWSLVDKVSGDIDSTNSNSFSYTSGQQTDGTGANQADRIYAKRHTINAGGTLDLDLAGSLVDFFGNTITFAKVTYLYIELVSKTPQASSIEIGGAAANQFVGWIDTAAAKIKVPGPGIFALGSAAAGGYTVTPGTGDILRITNNDGANAAEVNIAIIGRSA